MTLVIEGWPSKVLIQRNLNFGAIINLGYERFHLIKMRVSDAFLLQVGFGCSNLRVAEIPCFAGPNKWGGQSRGIFLTV